MDNEFVKTETSHWFSAYASENQLRDRTKTEYWRMIHILCRTVKKDFLDISYEDAQIFQDKMVLKIQEGDLSLKTLRLRLYCYDSFSNYLYTKNIIEKNPFSLLKKPIVDDTPYTSRIPGAEKCDKLLEIAARTSSDMYFIFSLVLRMGLTSTEICSIKTRNVITFENDLVIYFFTPGGKQEQRYLVVPDDLKEPLSSYRDTVSTEYLFANRSGEKLSQKALDKRVRKLITDNGLGKLTLRDLRNRAIYQMVHDGADIAEIAKYNNLSMRRVHTFSESPFAQSEMLSICPANLSRLKIVTEE